MLLPSVRELEVLAENETVSCPDASLLDDASDAADANATCRRRRQAQCPSLVTIRNCRVAEDDLHYIRDAYMPPLAGTRH